MFLFVLVTKAALINRKIYLASQLSEQQFNLTKNWKKEKE